jgi:hypothetical protein
MDHRNKSGDDNGWDELLLPRPLLIERKQPRQNFVVRQLASPFIIAPAVSLGHCLIQRLVSIVELSRALVVKVGEGALFKNSFGFFINGQIPVRVARHHFRHPLHKVRRVQRVFAAFVEKGVYGCTI